MKKCKNITGWTDYPFTELGDQPYVKAPIRHVQIVSYDNDKYAKIIYDGHYLEVKRGYLYGKCGRSGRVPTISRRKLERMVKVKI